MQFIDLKKQYKDYQSDIDAAIARVLEHGAYVMGPEVAQLEQELASYVGVKHCVATSNGTTALAVSLMALHIGPGDEVITTPFSFFASAEAIALLGATPVFVDVEPHTYNINPHNLRAAITSKTKAIMPVSLYGQTAELTAINAIAAEYGLPVVEDAAQSFGAEHHGRRSCGLTTLACTSFFPSKPLGCYGDGGACFTNDDDLATELRAITNHGQKERYQHDRVGINGRLDSIQAAVLLEKLKHFDREIAQRQQVAQWYQQHLDPTLTPPTVLAHNVSVYAQYTIQVQARDQLQQQLAAHHIPTAVHYPKGLHQQPGLEGLIEPRQSFPVTEHLAARVLSLPFHPYLSLEDVKVIANQVNQFALTEQTEVV